MKSNYRYGIGLVFVAVAAVASVLAAPELPQQVAVHWSVAGEADGFMSRWAALAFLPALSLALLVDFALPPLTLRPPLSADASPVFDSPVTATPKFRPT